MELWSKSRKGLKAKNGLFHVLFHIIPHNSTWAQVWTPDIAGASGIDQDPDEAETDLGESDLPLEESTGDSTGEGSVISCVHTLFSHGADSVDFPAFARALSRLPASQTDFVPPVPVQLSEAVASRLISVEVYNDFTASERKFVQLATDWDWTQSETQAVLRDERSRLEEVRPDLIRRVRLFENLFY